MLAPFTQCAPSSRRSASAGSSTTLSSASPKLVSASSLARARSGAGAGGRLSLVLVGSASRAALLHTAPERASSNSLIHLSAAPPVASPARRPLTSFDQSVLGAYGYSSAPKGQADAECSRSPPAKAPRVRIEGANCATLRATQPTSFPLTSTAPTAANMPPVEHSPLELLERQPPALFLLCSEAIANFGLECATF